MPQVTRFTQKIDLFAKIDALSMGSKQVVTRKHRQFVERAIENG